MSYSFHDCLLQDALHGDHRDCGPDGRPAPEAKLERYQAPTPSDSAQLLVATYGSKRV